MLGMCRLKRRGYGGGLSFPLSHAHTHTCVGDTSHTSSHTCALDWVKSGGSGNCIIGCSLTNAGLWGLPIVDHDYITYRFTYFFKQPKLVRRWKGSYS